MHFARQRDHFRFVFFSSSTPESFLVSTVGDDDARSVVADPSSRLPQVPAHIDESLDKIDRHKSTDRLLPSPFFF